MDIESISDYYEELREQSEAFTAVDCLFTDKNVSKATLNLYEELVFAMQLKLDPDLDYSLRTRVMSLIPSKNIKENYRDDELKVQVKNIVQIAKDLQAITKKQDSYVSTLSTEFESHIKKDFDEHNAQEILNNIQTIGHDAIFEPLMKDLSNIFKVIMVIPDDQAERVIPRIWENNYEKICNAFVEKLKDEHIKEYFFKIKFNAVADEKYQMLTEFFNLIVPSCSQLENFQIPFHEIYDNTYCYGYLGAYLQSNVGTLQAVHSAPSVETPESMIALRIEHVEEDIGSTFMHELAHFLSSYGNTQTVHKVLYEIAHTHLKAWFSHGLIPSIVSAVDTFTPKAFAGSKVLNEAMTELIVFLAEHMHAANLESEKIAKLQPDALELLLQDWLRHKAVEKGKSVYSKPIQCLLKRLNQPKYGNMTLVELIGAYINPQLRERFHASIDERIANGGHMLSYVEFLEDYSDAVEQ